MINAVIFDMDGLMFDTERESAIVWKQIGEKWGITVRESFLANIRGSIFSDFKEKFRGEFGSTLDFEAFYAEKNAVFRARMEEKGVPVKPGLYELLAWLKENKIKTCLATSSRRDTVDMYFKQAGVEEYFQHYVTGDMVTRGKPDPQIFLQAAGLVSEAPENCMVLEDSLNGIRAAIAGGFKAVMIPDLTQPDEEILSGIYAKCSSLSEVIELIEGNRE